MQISPLGGLPLGSYLQCTQDGLSDLSPNRVTACLVNLNLTCQVLEYEQTAGAPGTSQTCFLSAYLNLRHDKISC